MYNGDRVKYATEQLEKLFWIIEKTKKIEQKVGLDSVPRILVVCDSQKLLEGIINRMKKNKAFWVEHIEELIFFNLDESVWKEFGTAWVNLEDRYIQLNEIISTIN